MKHWMIDAATALCALLITAGPALAAPRAGAEGERQAISRTLHLTADSDAHFTPAHWNGHDVVFVDYVTGPDRQLAAFERTADGHDQAYAVTTGEEEGGTADVAAIGFAPIGAEAGRADKAEALIVLLSWPVRHADVNGTLYEVRIFAAPRPGQTALTPLATLTKHFDHDNCECSRSGGPDEHFPFKTIAAIKAEMKRMGL